MRSRSTLRARSLYNDRINRNLSDGLLNVLFLMDYLGRKNNLFLS